MYDDTVKRLRLCELPAYRRDRGGRMMDLPIRAFDSFRVEEAYNWHDDVMEITRRIVHETDQARLSNIANHFEVDLSEIRAFLEMKQQQQRKPQTNADRIRAMSDEALAEIMVSECPPNYPHGECHEYEMIDGNLDCSKCWLDYLKKEANNV